MMWFFWFPFLFIVPLVIWLVRGDRAGFGWCGMSHADHGQTPPPPASGPDPIAIVRMRLAKGEITPAEYEEIRRALG